MDQALLEFFPHDTIRPGQVDLVSDIDQAIREKKILLAHAPTGLGKTASALAVAVHHALASDKIVFFLTNRHTQHQIAIETLQLLSRKTGKTIPCTDLIGKRWMCNQSVANLKGNDFMEFCKTVVERGECEFYNNVFQEKQLTVPAKQIIQQLQQRSPIANEEIMVVGQEEKMCSYELALQLAKKAKVIIADYNYLFNPFVQKTFLGKIGKELSNCIVIVDEGHNLPSRVTDMLSTSLSTITLGFAIQEAVKYRFSGLIPWLQELNKILVDLDPGEEKEQLVDKDHLLAPLRSTVAPDIFAAELEAAAEEVREKQRRSFLGTVGAFLERWQDGGEEGYVRLISQRPGKLGSFISLEHSCLDPAVVTKDIFTSISAGVVMSGTLNPTFFYRDVLAIERAVEKTYPSPFPPENKMTLIIPETSTRYISRGEAMFQAIAEKCSQLAEFIPGNVALFFPSYALRDTICHFLQTKKKMFWEKKEMSIEEKMFFLEEFKAARSSGGILLGVAGANFAEGIDFPGDVLQGVVVVGLPLSKPDLKTKELIRYYDLKFNKGWDYGYTYPAMSKSIQSAGRCIRSETDRGVVIFLDERFAWQQYYACFSDKVGLRVTKKYEPLIREFFAKGAVSNQK